MPFRPNVNDQLTIDSVSYYIAEHPAAPGIPYGQEGRQGIVYALASAPGGRQAGGQAPAAMAAALKVFKPHYRFPALAGMADKLAPYADLPGLTVCRRVVLTPQRHGDLLNQHPDLIYAMLMPWIDGPTWMEVVLDRQALSPQRSLALARSLAETLTALEQRGLAHADLSAPNVMLPALAVSPAGRGGQAPSQSPIELVDVEQMYGGDMTQPAVMPSSSAGYSHRSAGEAKWGVEADRFAGAVLLAEMLGWCDEAVRAAGRQESYFAPDEMQQECERYQVLHHALQEWWSGRLAGLFSRAWHSETLRGCPTFGEWLVALPQRLAVPASAGEGAEISVLLMQARRLKREGQLADASKLYQRALGQLPSESPLRSEVQAMMADLPPQPAQAAPDIADETPLLAAAGEQRDLEQDQGTFLVSGRDREQILTAPAAPPRRASTWIWAVVGVVILIGLIGLATLVIGSNVYRQMREAGAVGDQATGTAQAEATAVAHAGAAATADWEAGVGAQTAESLSSGSTMTAAAEGQEAAMAQATATALAHKQATATAQVGALAAARAVGSVTAEAAAAASATPTATATAQPTATATRQAEASPTATSTQATPTPVPVVASPAPPVPALGGKLAFSLPQGTSYKAYVVEVGPTTPEELYADVSNARQPALSYDGEWLLVNSTGGGLDAIARATSNGHQIQAATCAASTGESGRPVWSPDGRFFAFDGLATDPDNPQIYIQKVGEIDCDMVDDRLQIGGGYVTDHNGLYPLWGPDDRIYFRSCATWDPQGGSQCGTWSVRPDGGDVLQLADDLNYLPTDVSRDRLLLMSSQEGNWEVYSVGLQGGTPQNLTNQPTTEVWGTLSPDGRTMAYLSNRGGGWAIWLADVDGASPRAWLPIKLDWGEVDPDRIAQERMSWSK